MVVRYYWSRVTADTGRPVHQRLVTAVLHTSWLFVLQDSLAAEIEGTMRKEMSLEDPDCEEHKYG